jgi:hypothetical protein
VDRTVHRGRSHRRKLRITLRYKKTNLQSAQQQVNMRVETLLVLSATCVAAVFAVDFTVKNCEDTPGLYYDHIGQVLPPFFSLPRKGPSFLPWGTERLTCSPSRCSPGRHSCSWVDSRCVWLYQAPPLLQVPPFLLPWGNREGVIVSLVRLGTSERCMFAKFWLGIVEGVELWGRQGIDLVGGLRFAQVVLRAELRRGGRNN